MSRAIVWASINWHWLLMTIFAVGLLLGGIER